METTLSKVRHSSICGVSTHIGIHILPSRDKVKTCNKTIHKLSHMIMKQHDLEFSAPYVRSLGSCQYQRLKAALYCASQGHSEDQKYLDIEYCSCIGNNTMKYSTVYNIHAKITCKLYSNGSCLHPVHWESTIVGECRLALQSAKEVGRGLDQHSTGKELMDQMVLQLYMCCSTVLIYKIINKRRMTNNYYHRIIVCLYIFAGV